MTSERILIVENDGIIVAHLRVMLAASGYVPSAVASGEEAIQQALEERPDLILMDIRLAGEIDGVQVAARIRARLDVPVIFLTAYTEGDLVQRAKVTEPYGYLAKPVQERELLATIEMAFYKHGMEMRLRESEERYRAIFEQAADSIMLTDAATGEIVEFNDQAHEKLGYTREEFAKLKTHDFVTESAEQVVQHTAYIIKQGRDAFETKHKTKSGEIRDIQARSKAISIAGNKFVPSAWQDITERVREEEEIARSQRLLLALSQAAQAVQRARTPEQVYHTIGDEVTKLGYDTTIFSLADERTHNNLRRGLPVSTGRGMRPTANLTKHSSLAIVELMFGGKR